ncbi:MAG: hypothetical protein M3Y80_08175 [Verrucomicrobiota bacterium]|nr:hypothetical protein [Verrucomicrobiota bacterium]
MKKHATFVLVAAAAAAAVANAFAADDLPQPLALARYEPMMNRSPFAVATAPAPPPAATPNFAKDLYVANVARTSSGDLVTIASSSDKNFKKYLTTETPVDGYSVSGLEWSERVGGSKVTVSKDGQFATLTFNQSVLSQPIGAPGLQLPGQPQQPQTAVPQPLVPQAQLAQPQGAVGVPAVPAYAAPAVPNTTGEVPANGIRPAPVPTLPTPPPTRTRGVIQRNPKASAQDQLQNQ